jgi:hypothetical protein
MFLTDIFLSIWCVVVVLFSLQYIVHGSLCCQIISYNFVIMVYFSTFLNAAICDHTFLGEIDSPAAASGL